MIVESFSKNFFHTCAFININFKTGYNPSQYFFGRLFYKKEDMKMIGHQRVLQNSYVRFDQTKVAKNILDGRAYC